MAGTLGDGRRRLWLAAAVAAWLVAGCAVPPRAPEPDPAQTQTGPWTGRLALQVQGDPRASFSAAFELRGQSQAGQLSLYTPLGGTAAVLQWSPGSATLQADGKTRAFDSLDALVAEATGAPVPVAALFDWLSGTATAVPGWQPDLSQLPQGRLHARRLTPPPVADLRVVLDR